ncbi:multicopper oxidase domain-containing protein [Actinomadura sp. NAK00032]|uniref:multicopper oxidase domain-containing protein n=1 Tax=Actinomadura sp. NAK00032 TaxID=2742128 RepID=UPI0015928177|nr:multicopper oxidase domain-containing protein [Actinomadura sp. NAK00032]QKW38335.1 multicopper oxidase domain-containing protein [Actinomadura sp. NAK00032]
MTSIGLRPKVGPPPPAPRRPRATWHAAANGVVLAWLALTIVAALVRHELPAPRWLLIHLFLLGAVTNAIVTWTEHFASALLRIPAPPDWWPMTRLAALNTGIVAVLYGFSDGLPWVAVGGAVAVVAVVAAHISVLALRGRGALGGRFAHVVGWYLWAGAALIAGGTLGGLMASGRIPSEWHGPMRDAHAHVNILGWVGLAVLGTLFTLWPTVLRTRMVDGTGRIARWSLRIAVPGLGIAVGGLLAELRWVVVAGLVVYAVAAGLALVPFVRTLVQRRPHTPASWMLAAGTLWFAVTLLADASRQSLSGLLPLVLVGFVGQTLLGALTFLLPVVMGGGPAALKSNAALIERFWIARVAAINVAVPLLVLPVPGWANRAGWLTVLAALAAFVLLAVATILRSHRPSPVVAGITAGVVLSALAVGVAAGNGGSPPETVAASGTRVVEVTLANMRIQPGTIEAAPGTRLVLRVTNKDAMQHDLRLASGQATPMLDRGESATLTVPPLKGAVEGWCTVAGHRAAGMTMQIKTTGGRGTHTSSMGHQAMGTGQLDLSAHPSAGWKPYDAALKPAPGGRVHRLELRASDRELEVAPGVRQTMWTFGGTVPGPVLRGRVGDVFVISLVNDTSMGHGIDFHAGSLAPDVPMRTIGPGERLTYRFTAERAGAWLYHCSTMPMLQHIANGMYGAVIIDPPNLPAVDREYVLVQGELYLGAPGSEGQVAKMREGRPDAWMFNGAAAGYDHAPLTARTGDRVRVWVVDAGPSSSTAFHIVGAQFDTLYKEGAYRLRKGDPGGAQILDLAAGQGGFVETVVPEAGHYPFVDHDMRHGESGAHGILKVTD